MAARKLQQEIDKCFKKVGEGVMAFEDIYEKILQTTNPSQKEKLEDALKKEIKKLQRSRDQIKTWATMNDIKDKKPLLEKRKLIETQMEKFKAVEKEMKTKAYSKEGLSLASKLDPKEKEKLETVEFLSNMTEELERQIETCEAEVESIQATFKKGKKDTNKAERIAELEGFVERHKWHQNKLELLQRALENGNVEVEQVKELEEGIRYYVDNNQEVDFMEDEEMYDELNLAEEENLFGMGQEVDRVSSQDTQSIQDDTVEVEGRSGSLPGKGKGVESTAPNARRPSTQLKSPLPALATLHTPLPGVSGASAGTMKPAPIPTRTPGEPLKYASAAAAAAASDKNGVGIAPLPPPPGVTAAQSSLAPAGARASATTSPASQHPQPAQPPIATSTDAKSAAQPSKPPSIASSIPGTPAAEKAQTASRVAAEERARMISKAATAEKVEEEDPAAATPPLTNGESHADDEEDESVFHLPSSLQDLLESYEMTKRDISTSSSKPPDEHILATSMRAAPDSADAEAPRHYRPQNPFPFTPSHYPQEPLPIFDDPRLYARIETDALFYAFYYRQGTYQQYLAAKALKSQSWRFHKQYQTWFQRHEEPKAITEDYEQGTYRFFDYESTWMNRRKADFRFAYKFLEDEL
ncbi:CCR4-NOT transcription complex [Delitschia confertaspora ATCC 74209]|uniref:General negative regulator of transcription subunit n=1 Tax=Delitschia confertaspora ATCC 74209 TaxID=1513339 RepID=A0A9P4MZ09_9PLEO|nr:CCR4-NOT transcription complex [Delitschia confertaspora ATCC 74209]